jgi:hypothetical protein
VVVTVTQECAHPYPPLDWTLLTYELLSRYILGTITEEMKVAIMVATTGEAIMEEAIMEEVIMGEAITAAGEVTVEVEGVEVEVMAVEVAELGLFGSHIAPSRITLK